MAKTKVAILGAGMSSIATAYQLTATPELREKYNVTIYQLGWRIGGKGASGRSEARIYRIEEHGLHVWFGFYDNAFRMMRNCYAELARPTGTPLATLYDAFKPCDDFILYENYKGRWIGHIFHAPRNNQQPGDNDRPPTFWQMAENGLRWVLSLWVERSPRLATVHPGASPLFGVVSRLAKFHASVSNSSLSRASSHLTLIPLLTEFRNVLWSHSNQRNFDDDDLRFLVSMMDFVGAVIRGVAADNLIVRGLYAINDLDFREWLGKHGAHPATLENNVFVRMIYSAAFAFLDGDTQQPNFAAGVALWSMLLTFFCYKGSLLYKMQAGMGDTVFTPFYQVLDRRGVKFQFFNSVENLHISAGVIDSIDIIEQVKLDVGKYDPLISVSLDRKQKAPLLCWPNQPRWEQIKDGDALRDSGIDLETTNPPGAMQKTLHQGNGFDIVVLGIPVAALPGICGELYRDDNNFRDMIDHSRTTMTQAFQVWSNQDIETGLRWPYSQEFIMSAYVEPLDTYSIMNQLIAAENWPPEVGLKSIHYFCGVVNDVPGEDQAAASARIRSNAINYLQNDSCVIWPGGQNDKGFNWDTLIDPGNGTGQARFDAQFWRANFSKSERYVLSPAGSIKFRLKTDGTKYRNLFLTGDWIDNGGNAGSIECAVSGGMLAARAITGTQERIVREDDKWLRRDTSIRGGLMKSEQNVSSPMANLIANATRIAASSAQIVETGLAAGISTARRVVDEISSPTPPTAVAGLGDTVQQILNVAEEGVGLFFDVLSLAAGAVGAVLGGVVSQPPQPVEAGDNQPPPQKKIVILGGGVAGMSAAQELAERSFQVEIYEGQEVPGGKARTISKRGTGKPGCGDLPGEHGFRFFPGFYQNLIDTMKRIPYLKPGAPDRVVDNLVAASEVGLATDNCALVTAPAKCPRSWRDLEEAVQDLFKISSQVPLKDTLWFVNRLLVVATSCDERPFEHLETKSWWKFTDAGNRSAEFRKFYATGMTRCAVACRAEEVSARSAGSLVLQLLFKLAALGTPADRLLNGPTSEVWIEPWLKYLQDLKVKYFTCETVVSFECDGTKITGVTVRNQQDQTRTITADYYISAIPGDKMKDLIAPLLQADPSLSSISKLKFEWMNGIQFFMKRDVEMAPGHVMYFDSPWALTSVSQQQFWTKRIAANYGDGTVNGVLSVDISNWNEKGLNGKTAKECARQEIKEEVLKQISQHKGFDGNSIFDDAANIADWMLDPDIAISGDHRTGNLEPLLVTVTGSWPLRPQAVTKISNLFLASDYVQTSTDAVTMESANEAARLAVNGILKAVGSAEKCQVFTLSQPEFLEDLRAIDKILFKLGLPNPFDMEFAEFNKDGGQSWFNTEYAHLTAEAPANRFLPGIRMQNKIIGDIHKRMAAAPPAA